MKPRSAVANFILTTLTATSADALNNFAQTYKQKSHKALTTDQKARVKEIFDNYVAGIAGFLADQDGAPEIDSRFDYLHGERVEPTPAPMTDATNPGPASTDGVDEDQLHDFLDSVFGVPTSGPMPANVTINITIGDVSISHND